MGRARPRQTAVRKSAPSKDKIPFIRPQPRRIVMDKMPVVYEGEVIYPHVGETISVSRIHTQASMKAVLELMARDLSPIADPRKFTEAEDNEERAAAIKELIDSKEDMIRLLRTLLTGWALTNVTTGDPLPQPTALDAFDALTETELQYIGYAVMMTLNSGTTLDTYDPEAVVEPPSKS